MEKTRSNGHGLAKRIEQVGPHDHLCLIHETREEQFAAAIPFVRMGLERGEKCLYIATTIRSMQSSTPCAPMESMSMPLSDQVR
jgi:hypothetical protein